MSNNAAEIEIRAAYFLMRRGEPAWSDIDEQELQAWLDESLAHKAAYWRLEYGYALADRVTALGAGKSAQERIGPRAVAIAASILFLISATVALLALHSYRKNHQQPVQYAAGAADVAEINLSDGSKIALNSGSSVRVGQAKQRREMWIDHGEAYFEVAHDANRPFIVHTGKRDIRVLGTKFVVTRASNTVSVAVVEGRVRFDDPEQNTLAHSTTLVPGQRVISDGVSTLIEFGSVAKIEDSLGWRQGILNFDNTTIESAVNQFNRYNQKKLAIGDRATAARKISGTFRMKNVDGFARLLEAAYGMNAQFSETEIIISQGH